MSHEEPFWWLTKDGDRSCLALFRRHYSCRNFCANQFVGPGEHIVLRTDSADAMFVWRKHISNAGQLGVECSIFRSEGPYQASELIRQADAIADFCWPRERHYTFVNSEKVRGTVPGYCFIRAGWPRCGMTVKKLLILERKFRDMKVSKS